MLTTLDISGDTTLGISGNEHDILSYLVIRHLSHMVIRHLAYLVMNTTFGISGDTTLGTSGDTTLGTSGDTTLCKSGNAHDTYPRISMLEFRLMNFKDVFQLLLLYIFCVIYFISDDTVQVLLCEFILIPVKVLF